VPSCDPDTTRKLACTNYSFTCLPYPTFPERPQRRSRRIWTYWTLISWLGTINIEIRQCKRWDMPDSRWSTYFSISVIFWPSWLLLRRRCISLLYNTELLYNAYHQILPMVATFPVIRRDASVWHLVQHGDIHGLRQAFEAGLANPNDQDEHGHTLLHVSERQSRAP
jgi:hypothetical protein